MGPGGLRQAGMLCRENAARLRGGLAGNQAVCGVPAYPIFHEFVFQTAKPAAEVLSFLRTQGILGGLDLGRYHPDRSHQVLVCATEKRNRDQTALYLRALGEI
jgi:glycine dehydrogenase subunit 1